MRLKRWFISIAQLAAQTIAALGILSAASPAGFVTPVLHASGELQVTSTLGVPAGTPVVWSLNPQVGAVSAGGMYTAPVSITSVQTVLVTSSTSVSYASQSGSIAVSLRPTVTLSMSPGQASIFRSQTQQCTATLTGAADTSVVWSINPALGSISTAGLYTAPVTVAARQTVTVTATSNADPGTSASTNIMVNPFIAISVSPTSTQIFAAQSQQFTET
jgi:trimeric autotransporter adhesin